VNKLPTNRNWGKRAQEQLTEAEDNMTEAGLREIIASSGISPRLWRLYAYFWLVCLVFPVLEIAHTPQTPIRLLVALFGLVIFAAVYFWVMWPYPLSGHRSN
jgi:Flp pilus assembly protein TadB